MSKNLILSLPSNEGKGTGYWLLGTGKKSIVAKGHGFFTSSQPSIKGVGLRRKTKTNLADKSAI